jgi:glutathione reductase (NADPH)
VHRGPRPLEAFDPDLVGQLLLTTRALGVEVVLQTTVTGVERRGDEFVVATRTEDGTGEFVADLVVHAAGRVPEIDELDLEAAGIARVEGGGVEVNQYLQSVTNPAVYAAGDAASGGGFPLTPVAGMQSGIVATNLLEGNSRTGRVLGAHLFGHHAEEVINIFGLAIRKGLTAEDLKDMVYAYPTSSSDIGYML